METLHKTDSMSSDGNHHRNRVWNAYSKKIIIEKGMKGTRMVKINICRVTVMTEIWMT